jgi:phosphomannomutase/phosphoglucomutase
MKLESSIFRENDIRGLVETELGDDAVYAIGRAYATLLTEAGGHACAVGMDVRTSGPRLKATFIRGVRDGGVHVTDLGAVTTPVAYFAAFQLPVDGSVMITASHNPKEYNGFKLGIGQTTIHGEDIRRAYEIAASGEWSSGEGGYRAYDLNADYCAWFKSHFSFGKNGRKPRVVFDPANAAGALFCHTLLAELGCELIPLYCEVDGNFPNHHPDPTVEKNLAALKAKVLETGADIGIGFDGDGDRIGVVDDLGRMVMGDILTLLLAREILKEKPGAPIVFEVKSSLALVEGLQKAGAQPVMWKVGHSLIKKKMKELGAPLAGEVSGHMFFADRYYGYDDAMYAACRLLEILDRGGHKLSELLADVPFYPSTPEIRAQCESDAEKFRIAKTAAEYFKKNGECLDIDGVRILYPDGWGLVRASNTQPDLVLRFEARTPERVVEIRNAVLSKLSEFGRIKVDAAA